MRLDEAPRSRTRTARSREHLTAPKPGAAENQWNHPAARPGSDSRHHASETPRNTGKPTRTTHRWIEAKATRGYDVTKGHDFLSYAVPTIRGELRRHFRDRGWMVRPPRRIQELQASANAAREELTFKLGRSPEPTDIAAHLGESPDAVIEALSSDGCFFPASLDHPASDHATGTVGELLPVDDDNYSASEVRIVVGPAVGRLPERDRQILTMRFYEGLTQQEIAARIGISQMQVSRLLTGILNQLRTQVGEVRLP